MAAVARMLNAVALLAICALLLVAFYWQLARGELPCPLCLLQRAALIGAGLGLMLNVRREDLEKVLSVLPALKRPTISNLSELGWVAVNTVIDEKTVREIIPRLKAANAQGIVEYPLNKIVM